MVGFVLVGVRKNYGIDKFNSFSLFFNIEKLFEIENNGII